MSDYGLRFFNALTENKKKQTELKDAELQIDCLQKRMLTRYWKDKIDIFDEMIRLNVKTPRYGDTDTSGTYETINLGSMKLDAKLMSNKPVSLQRGNKKVEPVINIEGSDAVCYPSKAAKKGRKVALSVRVLKMMEQCKTLSKNIDSIQSCKEGGSDAGSTVSSGLRSWSPKRRPFTAPRLGQSGLKTYRRGAASAGIRHRVEPISKDLELDSSTQVTSTPRIQATSTPRQQPTSTSRQQATSTPDQKKPGVKADTREFPNIHVSRRMKSAPKTRFK